MVYFRTLAQVQPQPRLSLAADNAFPVGKRRARDLVSLRCVAGQEFTRATGAAHAADLTPAQMHFGHLGIIDRNGPMGNYPPFERF